MAVSGEISGKQVWCGGKEDLGFRNSDLRFGGSGEAVGSLGVAED